MSNDTKWTPGPWWEEEDTGDIVAKDGEWEICTFTRMEDRHLYADRHLIAAAPDLYEALEAAMRFIDCHAADHDLTGEMMEAWSKLADAKPRDALAKARGEHHD